MEKALDTHGYVYANENIRLIYNNLISWDKELFPHDLWHPPMLKVVFRDMTCRNRALIFAAVHTDEHVSVPLDPEIDIKDERTGSTPNRHTFAVFFVEIKTQNERIEGENDNYTVFNCHTIRPRHWRLLNRIDNLADMERIPVDCHLVPGAFKIMLKNRWVMNARMTRNALIIATDDEEKPVEQIRKNIYPKEEAMFANTTASVKDINVFILATINNKLMRLDKDRNFTTSMDLEWRPPLDLTYNQMRHIIMMRGNYTWPTLIIKKNRTNVYYIVKWTRFLRRVEELHLETIRCPSEEELHEINGEYFPRANERRRRHPNEDIVDMPYNIHGMAKEPHKEWKRMHSHGPRGDYSHCLWMERARRETQLQRRMLPMQENNIQLGWTSAKHA